MLTDRLLLKRPAVDDGAALLAYRLRNREHLRQWEPAHADDYYSIDAVLTEILRQADDPHAVHWLIYRRDSPQLLGRCGFTNIVLGPFQACHLGFSLDHEQQGEGIMYEALQAAIQHMLTQHGLHRIMANYQPHNHRSEKLLQRLGFEREGYAKAYLKIDGKWADHVLASLVA